jgi:nondiscriminating glutamyl-tRNA synthetase
MSGIYIRKADLDRLTRLSVPYLAEAKLINKDITEESLEKIKGMISVIRGHLTKLKDISIEAEVFFNDKLSIKDKEAKSVLAKESAKTVLGLFLKKLDDIEAIDEELFKGVVKEIGNETKLKGAAIYHPIRVALTGQLNGPELKLIIPVLDKESCIKRVKQALGNRS